MTTHDAIVVGGGPAGSTAAWALVRAGLDVLVLDRAAFPRDKPCAGWITPQVVESLALDVDEYRRGRVWQPITGFRTGLIGARLLETRYPRAVSYGIRRCEFDAYLLHRSGARLMTGVAASELRWADGHWIVNASVRAPVLVGAGGHVCPVARHLNPGPSSRPIVAAQEIEIALEAAEAARGAVDPERPELYFCRDLRGYGWCFHKEHVLNVGFGRLMARDDARQVWRQPSGWRAQARLKAGSTEVHREHEAPAFAAHVREFLTWLIAEDRVPARVAARWSGHAYLLYDAARPALVGDGVVLVGDAAGLACEASGEGIRPAIESGLLAARAILDARGRYARADLAPYARALRARFGASRATRLVARLLPAPIAQATAARGLSSRWFTRHVVLDRWFLRRHLPALAPSRVASSTVRTPGDRDVTDLSATRRVAGRAARSPAPASSGRKPGIRGFL